MSLKDVLSTLLILALILASLNVQLLLSIPLRTDIPLAVVSSWSMEPTLHIADIIVVYGGSNEYAIGDVIVYTKYGRKLIVHRVVEIEGPKGPFITKGDANIAHDIPPVKLSQVKGKVVLVVPYLGVFKLMVEGLLGK